MMFIIGVRVKEEGIWEMGVKEDIYFEYKVISIYLFI